MCSVCELTSRCPLWRPVVLGVLTVLLLAIALVILGPDRHDMKWLARRGASGRGALDSDHHILGPANRELAHVACVA